MLMPVRIMALLTATMSAMTSVAASGPTTNIPRVDGVTIGMAAKDVVRRLKAERIHATVIARPCLSDYLSAHRRVLPIEDRAGHCTAQISWRYAGGDLLAQFTEDVPRRPGVSITTDMALDYPKDPNWVTVILREAGPPSATDGKRPWSSALWCLGFVCDMKHTMSDPNSSLWLSVDRCCGFNLDDAVAATRREAAIRKQLHAHGIVLVP